MSDDLIPPVMPRLPRAIATQPIPTEKPLKSRAGRPRKEGPDSIGVLTLDQLGCVLMAQEWSKEEAAKRLNWSIERVEDTLALPEVAYSMKMAQKLVIENLAKSKIRNLRRKNINPVAIEERLMELAMLDPTETKGSVDGQVKALRTLAEILGMFSTDDPLKGKSRKELEGFVQRTAQQLGPGLEPPLQ